MLILKINICLNVMINAISSGLKAREYWANVNPATHVGKSYIGLGFIIYDGRTVL